MTTEIMHSKEVQQLLDRISGLQDVNGDDRAKRIVRKIVSDLFETIDTFDVSPEEFWKVLNFLQQGAPEFGLIAPGLGFDHYLDLRMDAADRKSGIEGGTPRTIEGPLYVAGAPLSEGFARLDDGSDSGEVLIMQGTVYGLDGQPVSGAVVDVWHANTLGNYSYFDSSQSAYNNRRRIATDAEGRYKFRSIMPSGYAVPPGGATDRLLQTIGRHGRRPAHIHFFVSAPNHRVLTTQINIDGDPDLHDDFAQATRDGLIPELVRREDAASISDEGLDGPYSEIIFDFSLVPTQVEAHTRPHERSRVEAVS